MSVRPVNIALDAMGGDHGVEATVRGAARLSLEESDIRVICVGELPAMMAVLEQVHHDPSRLELVASGPAVPMCEDPRTVLAATHNASIQVACDLVKKGEADAVVSAGNTGAAVLAAAHVFGRLPGIRRAALASVYPTASFRGPHRDPFALILDIGATLSASAEDLVGFAVMGSAYSSVISEVEAPRVALLSNGTEPNKGTPAIIEANKLLAKTALNFTGNVEGLDIPRGTVDVVVCDGFLGNVVLKMLEGLGEVLHSVAEEASARKLSWRLALSMLQDGIQTIERMADWKNYGGAPLLGLDHVLIKAHGRSEARAIRNAVKIAAKTVRGDLIGRIERGMREQSEG